MGAEVVLTWQGLAVLLAFVLVSLWVISVTASQRFQSVGWAGVLRGYVFALGVLAVAQFIQLEFETGHLLANFVAGSYLVLPWVTLFVLPSLLWQPRPALALATVAGAVLLVSLLLTILTYPRSEGYDTSLVFKNELSSFLDLLVALICTALAFFLGAKSKLRRDPTNRADV